MSGINTNLTSLTTQQNLRQNQSSLSTSMERLSSGLRVNSAKDDAAGQAISNRFQAQRIGLGQGARNANDGISLSQTAHGVLDNINDKLQRIRELTVQSLSSGTLKTSDRDFIQAEINQNLMEIDRLAETSKFNGIPLMTGQAGRVDLQVGANDGQQLGVDLSPPGFSVDALGLTDFNVAGEPGTVTPRDTLFGPADDIVLEDSRTTVNYPVGAEETLYALGDVSLAGDHKLEGDAITSYYVSTGGGQFSRVNVSATHETATDLSVVDVTDPQPLFKTDFSLDPTFISGLATNQKVVKADDTYYIETDNSGVLSYQETANLEVSFQGISSPTASISGGVEPATNYQTASSFEFGGTTYNLADYENVEYRNASNLPLASSELVKDQDNPNPEAYYLKSTNGGDTDFYRLDSIRIEDNLDVGVSAYTPVGGETFTATNAFEVGGETYTPANFDNIVYDNSGTEVNVTEILQSNDDGKYYAFNSGTGDYFSINAAVDSQDLTLKADSQAYSGVDVESQSTNFNNNIIFTPEIPDFSSATPDFQGDLSEITNPQLIRSTSDDQWVIQGDLPGGGFGYYDADLEVVLDDKGQPTEYTVTSTQSSPTILGVDEDIVDKVHGISTVTIDPRNVSVEYTDIEGRSYSNVLTEGEDGNYYFELPGESSLLGGYKTATLVDHDQRGEIVLRTENGNSEVVVYYPTELENGVNRAFFVQTDGDGFGDNGTPHTRLRIQEVGEDFRIQVPRNPLAALDKAIGMVDSKRSHLGAVENRLESAITTNETTAINLASAESRIMDADYAQETANMVRSQIIQQAGNSMLAQANVIPESVLALLG